MSQGPHDPFLASTAAVSRGVNVLDYTTPTFQKKTPEWPLFLKSPTTVLAALVAVAEWFLLLGYQHNLIWLPMLAIGAIVLARWQRPAWIIVHLCLAGGAVGIFLYAPTTTSVAFAYPALFAGVIAMSQTGRILESLVVAVVISVAATFYLDAAQTQRQIGNKKVIVVAAMWATGEAKQPILEDLIRQFEKEYSGYQVIVHWDGRWVLSKNRPRLLTMKDVPDLIEGSKEELAIVVQEKYSVPLDGYMNAISPETGRPWREDWKPALFDLGRYHLDPETNANGESSPHPLNGKLSMVSGIYYDFVYFYNKAAARKLGITKMPETWDEFMAACDKAKAAGIEPIMLDTDYKDLLADTLLQSSVPENELRKTIMGGPGRKPFTDPMYVRLFKLERTIADKYLMRGWQASPYPKAQQQFAVGNGLFVLCGTWLPGELRSVAIKDKNIFDVGVIPFPHFNDEPSGTSIIQDSGWLLLKDGKDPEGAVLFLQFLSNHWGREIALKDGNPVAFARDPIPPDLIDIAPQLTEMKRAVSDPIVGFAPKWRQYVFLQKHEDFFMANPGDKDYVTAEDFAADLEKRTQDYIAQKGENKWQ